MVADRDTAPPTLTMVEHALNTHPRGIAPRGEGSTPWRAVHNGLVHGVYLYDAGLHLPTNAFACPGFNCEADTNDYLRRAMPPLQGVVLIADDAVVTCVICAGTVYPDTVEDDLEEGGS